MIRCIIYERWWGTAAHEIEISVFENWTGNVNYLRKQYSRYNDNKNEIQTQVMR